VSNQVPYVFYGIIVAVCASHAYANRNPYAVFSIGDDKRSLPCIPFSQLPAITYENRPSLQAFAEEIHRSIELEKKELALALPQISVSGLTAKTDFQAILNLPYPARQVLFGVNQLLWSFAGPVQQYRIQRATTSINQEAELSHRTNIRLESELTFLDTLLQVRKKNTIQALNQSSKNLFAQALTRNSVGFLSNSQFKQTESDFATSQSQVLQYQDDLKQSYSFLERALSIPLMSSEQLPNLLMDNGLLQFSVAPLDRYIENAMHLRNELVGKAWEVDRAEKTSSLLIHKYAPTLNFSFNLARFNFYTRADGFIKQLTFQLALTAAWNFDSFSSAHASSAAEAETISLKLQQLDLSLEIQRDVKAAYYALQALLKEVEAEKTRYVSAEALFQTQEHQFEIGQISHVDYTVAKTNWQTAQYALDQQTIAAEKKYRELLFAAGYPPEFEPIQNLRS
jgi:outer membrane protein TolC